MDPRHGFVFRLKLFGRQYCAVQSQYLDAFGSLDRPESEKNHARFQKSQRFYQKMKHDF